MAQECTELEYLCDSGCGEFDVYLTCRSRVLELDASLERNNTESNCTVSFHCRLWRRSNVGVPGQRQRGRCSATRCWQRVEHAVGVESVVLIQHLTPKAAGPLGRSAALNLCRRVCLPR